MALWQISQLCAGSPESVQLSDWVKLTDLRRPTPKATQDLFYPRYPDDVLAELEDYGDQHRAKGFLTALDHHQYYAAYRFVLEHPEQNFVDIQSLLRAGRTDGKIVSQVMSHVVRWVNTKPTEVKASENNKPPIWKDLVPILKITSDEDAGQQSRLLQRQIFDIVRDRLDDLEASLVGELHEASYLDRFNLPTWNEILACVQATIGSEFKGPLARFKTRLPASVPGRSISSLTQDLSQALKCLPQVKGNPALRNPLAVEELARLISPTVTQWAAQQCEQALAAQDHAEVPLWPTSVLQRVRVEYSRLSELLQTQTVMQARDDGDDPREVTSVTNGAELPTETWTDSIVENIQPVINVGGMTEEPAGVDLVSKLLTIDDEEMKERRKVRRQGRQVRAGIPSVRSWTPPLPLVDRLHSRQSVTDRDGPPSTSVGRVRSPATAATKAPWMLGPAARSSRD